MLVKYERIGKQKRNSENHETGISIAPQPCPVRLPDSDDEIYLAVALGAEVDAIITGNKKHFPEKKCRDIRIITPRQFLSATV